jgi:hypothetical protein
MIGLTNKNELKKKKYAYDPKKIKSGFINFDIFIVDFCDNLNKLI